MCIVEDELNVDEGKHVLAMFLNWKLFWMNNKTIIEFGLRVIWRIMEISEGVICLGRNTLVDLHNSSYDTQPHLLTVKLLTKTYSNINGMENKHKSK